MGGKEVCIIPYIDWIVKSCQVKPGLISHFFPSTDNGGKGWRKVSMLRQVHNHVCV